MEKPLHINNELTDEKLIPLVLEGNNKALEKLINRHKDFIYNLAFRMLGNTENAKDISQEIWIKVITKLATFDFESSFKTWLYRITVNHILNAKKSRNEQFFNSFEKHESIHTYLIENADNQIQADTELLIEETKTECLTGMLLCLSREQRMLFILGSIFNIDSRQGSEIFNISPENYRKQLSRIRKLVLNYMNGKCSLVYKNGSCNCKSRTKAAIKAGIINPDNPRFASKYLKKIQDVVKRNSSKVVGNILELQCQQEFQNTPFLILENDILKSVFKAYNLSVS